MLYRSEFLIFLHAVKISSARGIFPHAKIFSRAFFNLRAKIKRFRGNSKNHYFLHAVEFPRNRLIFARKLKNARKIFLRAENVRARLRFPPHAKILKTRSFKQF